MWIARDECKKSGLWIFHNKPRKADKTFLPSGLNNGGCARLNPKSFPEIKPGECKEVIITIKE